MGWLTGCATPIEIPLADGGAADSGFQKVEDSRAINDSAPTSIPDLGDNGGGDMGYSGETDSDMYATDDAAAGDATADAGDAAVPDDGDIGGDAGDGDVIVILDDAFGEGVAEDAQPGDAVAVDAGGDDA